jgi:hypothetical protein
VADEFGAFKRKMHEALDEAFRAREQDSYEKVAGMNQGAPGYADTAAFIAARYRKIYGGG